MKILIILSLFATIVLAQQHYTTTPVPILKQINRHNDDGSYSYGYEGGDGSFKIETKLANGEVKGKYGYVDETGNVRTVEYGAGNHGFEPAGSDINVPPPTISNNNHQYPLGPNEEDDGQYREDPNIYNDPKYNSKPSKSTAPVYRPPSNYNSAPNQFYQNNAGYQAPTQQPTYEPPQHRYQPQPQQQYYQQPQSNYQQPQSNYQQYQQPAAQQRSLFSGHPASDFDINTGSYSLEYTG